MTLIKKILGSYSYVVDQLGKPKTLYEPQTLAVYEAEVTQALEHLAYMSHAYSVEEIKLQLLDTQTYLDKKIPFSYAPGNFDASVFKLEHPQIPSESLHIAYVDDSHEAINCALSISFLQHNPMAREEEACFFEGDHSPFFTITVIKGTNFSPNDRVVAHFSHPDLLTTQNAATGIDVDVGAIHAELKKLLNSKRLSELLQGLFEGRGLSLVRFKAIKSRFQANQNIDNRDIKIALLHEVTTMAKETLPPESLVTDFTALDTRMKDCPDFFKDGNFESTLDDLFKKVRATLLAGNLPNKERLVYENELTLRAVELELKAHAMKDEADVYQVSVLSAEANKFRLLRDNGETSIGEHVTDLMDQFEARLKCQLAMNDFEKQCTALVTPTTEGLVRDFSRQRDRLLQSSQAFFAVINAQSIAILGEWERVFRGYSQLLSDRDNINHIEALIKYVQTIQTENLQQFVIETLLVAEREKHLVGFALFQAICTDMLEKDECPKGSHYYVQIQMLLQHLQGLMDEQNQLDMSVLLKSDRVIEYCLKALKNPMDVGVFEQLSALQESIQHKHIAALMIQVLKLAQYKRYLANITRFEAQLLPILECCEHEPINNKYHQQGYNVLSQVRQVAGREPCLLETNELMRLNEILESCFIAIDEPHNKENLAKLVVLSQSAPGTASIGWKRLGTSLLLFAGLALLVAGVLAAIPSGGTSLLLAVASATGVTLAKGASVVALTAASGFLLFKHNSEKGLAKSMTDLHIAVLSPS